MENKIAIVIVTCNRSAILQQSIRSLQAQSYAYSAMLVINNGSTDGTREWLDSQTGLEAIHQNNTGGAGGFYSGIKYAVEKGFDYIWVMDDDVVTAPDALEQLMHAAEMLPDFSFLCSKVVSGDGVVINTPGIDYKISRYNYPQWGQYAEHGMVRVKNSTFVSILINARHINAAGLPIRDFFNWGDDIDFTTRLSKQAPAYMVGKSIVTHLNIHPVFPSIFTEVDKRRIALHFYNVRNDIYISRKHKRKLELLADVFHYIKLAFGSLFTARGWYKTGVYLKGFFAGLFFDPPIVYPNRKR
jgi:GT2 family glycosyltransferase